MCERVKKCLSLCKVAGTCDCTSRVAHGLQATKSCTCAKHTEKLNRHASCSTTEQKVQTVHLVSSGLDSRLSQVARPSPQSTLLWKNRLFAFLSHSSINTLYIHEILRASRENFERETLEKNKIDSSTIFT